MAVEIERKFLVQGDDWCKLPAVSITQGYLARGETHSVRVRIQGKRGFFAVKGPQRGISREEFEYEIPLTDARALLQLCNGGLIDKVRHLVEHQGRTWEVDEFLGENTGLVVAELELQREDEVFERPQWLGKEVTQDSRYLNSNLAAHPFCSWPTEAVGGQSADCKAVIKS